MHSKQVHSRWWKIPIHATVIITLRAKGKNSLKEGESGRQETGKEQPETRSNGNQSNFARAGERQGQNEESVREIALES